MKKRSGLLIGCLVLFITIACAQPGYQFPSPFITNINLSHENETYCVPGEIISPAVAETVEIHSEANVDYRSTTKITLGPGFRAGGFNSTGRFTANCEGYGAEDMVILEPAGSSSIPKYGKIELGITLPDYIQEQVDNYFNPGSTSLKLNPYDPDQLKVEAIFEHVNTGIPYTWAGFYYNNYYEDEANDRLAETTTPYPWRVRFMPAHEGDWKVNIKVYVNNQLLSLNNCNFAMGFTCTAPVSPGPLEVGHHKRYFRFKENHQSFIPVGENIPWPSDFGTLDNSNPNNLGYHHELSELQEQLEFIKQLKDGGGNYVRIMFTQVSGSVEYGYNYNNSGVIPTFGNYRYASRYLWWLDEIFKYCEQNNIYIQLCLDVHTAYQATGNQFGDATWPFNPYNTLNNGGVLGSMYTLDDFLTNPTAIAHYQKRLRYYIARYGYSENLAAYEIMNETDQIGESIFLINTPDQYKEKPYATSLSFATKVEEWNKAMAVYIKTQDYYRHMVTTSYAVEVNGDLEIADRYFAASTCDFTSHHSYSDRENHNHELWVYNNSGTEPTYLDYDKPTHWGEIGHLGNLEECSPIVLHNLIWGTAFNGGAGPALPWVWDKGVHRLNDPYYDQYLGLKNFFASEDFEIHKFSSKRFPDINPFPYNHIEAFVLTNYNSDRVLGWVHNRSYYWGNTIANGNDCHINYPPPIAVYNGSDPDDDIWNWPQPSSLNEQVELRSMKAGNYFITWFETKTGSPLYYTSAQTTLIGTGHTLKINVPVLDDAAPDMAFKALHSDLFSRMNDTIYLLDSLNYISLNGDFLRGGEGKELIKPLKDTLQKQNPYILLSQEQNNVDEVSLSIKPNPSKGLFTLSGSAMQFIKLEILDETGRKIIEYRNGTIPFIFDISSSVTGFYHVRVTLKDTVFILKAIKI